MTKILLVCSAGMSTSLMVNKMKDAAAKRGLEAEIWAVADAEAANNIGNADIMMLGPQVRFLESKMKGIAGDKPVTVIANSGEILQELKRQGNNLNQAVRNCYFYPDEKDKVLSAAAECKRAYCALLSVIEEN